MSRHKSWRTLPHIDYVREGSSEGIELVMWLSARRRMADVAGGHTRRKVTQRFYHVPASNNCRWPFDSREPAGLTARAQRVALSPTASRTSHELPIRIALAGAGAFGIKHLDALKLIDGVQGHLADQPRPGQDPARSRPSTASAMSPPTWPTVLAR